MTDVGIKFSDWLEQQPASLLCSEKMRNEQGQMCGLGILADFLGIKWNKIRMGGDVSSSMSVGAFLFKTLGSIPFSAADFDSIYKENGPEAAKQFVVQQCRKSGL